MYGVDATSGTTVVVDIGGGSMEVTLGTAIEVRLARSFALGVIRLTDKYVTTDPLSRGDERRIVKYVRSTFESFAKQVIDYGPIGVSKGCGIHFAVADLRGTGRLDIIAPGKDGLYVFYNEGPAQGGR